VSANVLTQLRPSPLPRFLPPPALLPPPLLLVVGVLPEDIEPPELKSRYEFTVAPTSIQQFVRGRDTAVSTVPRGGERERERKRGREGESWKRIAAIDGSTNLYKSTSLSLLLLILSSSMLLMFLCSARRRECVPSTLAHARAAYRTSLVLPYIVPRLSES